MTTRPLRPEAFSLDDPKVMLAETEASEDLVRITPDSDASVLAVPIAARMSRPNRGFGWAAMFWSAIGGLVALALGLAITALLEDLFARTPALGWIGMALTAIAVLALLVIVVREAFGLFRLSAIGDLRERAAATIISDRKTDAAAIVRELLDLTRTSPPLARARNDIASHIDDIIDGADLLRFAERQLMAPLDKEAKRLITAAAKRVSIVTAVSPRALIDIFFVIVTSLGLMRRLAYLYGGRPGVLGLLRLLRLCVAHLTVTGGLAISDGIIQQMLGHGIVAKLSTRIGEGVLNGLLTARLGLAAMEVVRPLPFVALPRPALADLAGDLLRQSNYSPA